MRKKSIFQKSAVAVLVFLLGAAAVLAGCGSGAGAQGDSAAGTGGDSADMTGTDTVTVTDDAGRTVEIPADINAIAPSGSVATMMLIPLASDLLVGAGTDFGPTQLSYLPAELAELPVLGQFYGGKSTLNMEALLAAGPQVIIDLGDKQAKTAEDMDAIQSQTGIPTLFFDGSLEHMADTYRTLGQMLGREEQAEEIAAFIDKTLDMAHENSARISEEDRVRVLYGTGPDGLSVNAAGSSQAQIIDLIGAENAVVPDAVTSKDGGTTVSLESLYEDEPDVILLRRDGPYDELANSEWAGLQAVKDGKYYEIPGDPYCWMSGPPSVNMVLGVWWLGQLLYPDIYSDYDMIEVAQEYFRIFWHYELEREEAQEILMHSYY